jgi:hypothetical protein
LTDSSSPIPPASGGRPPDDRPNLPARQSLDRSALDRVLKRAGELQAKAGEPDEEISEAQLIELGKEVGLSSEYLRQAIAEERTRVNVEEDHTRAGRWIGPAMVSARRVVPGTPGEVLAALDRRMQRDECLQIKRRYGDRIVWEARRDLFGNIRRSLNVGGRGYHLTRVHDVAATSVAVDGKSVLLRLDADLSTVRAARLRNGSITAAAGVAGGAAVIGFGALFAPVLLPFLAMALVPTAVGAGAAAAVLRSHRGVAERTQLALEQALDAMEHLPPALPNPAAAIIDALLPRPKR